MLVLELARGVIDQVFGLGGEADAEGAVGASGEGRQDIGIAHHLQQQTVTGRRVLLELLWGDDLRAVVCHRSRGDQ